MAQNIHNYFNYLYSLERTGIKYDLNNISRLLEALGNPHTKTKYIHIAGTNGKGGTASFLASVLMEHGLKTGLFTSPHILKFNERIRINGKTIGNNYIKTFLNDNSDLIKKIQPSFFEVSTALALKYFAEKNVDVAVIETGLGGRLDSTNIIKPELCIITQIAIDHTDFLGSTLTEIAKEKIGIVKKSVDVIVCDMNPELKELFKSSIEHERLYFLDDSVSTKILKQSYSGIYYELNIKDRVLSLRVYRPEGSLTKKIKLALHSPLPGKYQARNSAAAVLAAFKYLGENGVKISTRKLKSAVKNIKLNTGYRARFELKRNNGINYIFDVSHNQGGIINALSNLKNKKVDAIIFAMMNDKDYKNSIKALLPYSGSIIFTRPDYKRAIDPEVLYNYAISLQTTHLQTSRSQTQFLQTTRSQTQFGNENIVGKNFYSTKDVMESLRLSRKLAGKNGYVLIIGSFFLVSDAIKALKMQKEFS